VEPVIDPKARTGQFTAELMEEYQPMPLKAITPGLLETLKDSKYALLVTISGFSAVCLVASAVCFFVWARMPEVAPWLLYALITAALAATTHRVSHALWQRFDFDSVLIYCEMKGQYVTAEMQHGNVMRDTLKTTSSVTQIESMTFRLWVASLHTICFGKDATRTIRAMQPEDDAAREIADKLRTFAQEQAIILAPTSQADRIRQNQLQNMNAA